MKEKTQRKHTHTHAEKHTQTHAEETHTYTRTHTIPLHVRNYGATTRIRLLESFNQTLFFNFLEN